MKYTVKYQNKKWCVLASSINMPIKKYTKKEYAVNNATKMAKDNKGTLHIFDKKGLQSVVSYKSGKPELKHSYINLNNLKIL